MTRIRLKSCLLYTKPLLITIDIRQHCAGKKNQKQPVAVSLGLLIRVRGPADCNRKDVSAMNFNAPISKNKITFSILSCICVFFVICLIFMTGCGHAGTAGSPLEATGFYFDTVISIRLYEDDSGELLDGCMKLAEHYEQLLSATLEGSDIWKINHGNGSWVKVDEDTFDLLTIALDFARGSDGLVDPAVGGLSRLWNFGSANEGIVPSDEQIQEKLTHVDYNAIAVGDGEVMLTDPETQIDLGFIAKGFIGDKIKEYLFSEGVSHALINLGGNVVTLGGRPDGSPFRVGIRNPSEKDGAPLLTLELSDKSVVSSGNYERFFVKDGKLYHHILSTATGYPAESGLSQVTIISPDSTRADALSTLCYISGYEKAASLLENYPDIQAIFVTEDGEIIYHMS